MKHCSLCKVDVDSSLEYCPLCHNAISEVSAKKDAEMFPKYEKQEKVSKAKKTVTKVFLLLSIAIIATCVLINIMTKTIAWSVTVALAIVYLWVLVAHTIISRDTPFKKVLFQVIAIVVFLTSTNIIFSSNDWLTHFVYPSLAMLVTAVLAMITFCSKQRKKLLFGFSCIYVLMALVSGVFLIFKIDAYQTLNIINLMVQGFTLMAYLVFGGKTIISEASRKFHI